MSLVSSFTSVSLHRYAATGDANGEPLSREKESEKMEQLEREILDYPGLVSFKCNSYVSFSDLLLDSSRIPT